jgi:hypothetical protein
VTQVAEATEGDPPASFHSGPQSPVPGPLFEILEEVIAGIGFGEELAQLPKIVRPVEAVHLHGSGPCRRRLDGTRDTSLRH